MSKKTAKIVILVLTVLLISVILVLGWSAVRTLGPWSLASIPIAVFLVNLIFKSADVIDN